MQLVVEPILADTQILIRFSKTPLSRFRPREVPSFVILDSSRPRNNWNEQAGGIIKVERFERSVAVEPFIRIQDKRLEWFEPPCCLAGNSVGLAELAQL